MSLSFQEDDSIRESVHWIVGLSDGSNVYQDDHSNENVTWKRLREYLSNTGLHIVSFRIKFFSHIEEVAPPNKDGYFFVNKVSAVMFERSKRISNYYVVGYVDGDKIHTIDWLVPEIIPTGKNIRDIIENDPSLIMKV